MATSTTFVPELEYMERQYDFKKSLGRYPRFKMEDITGENNWYKVSEFIFQNIAPDLKDGWQVDQSWWGPAHVKYQKVRVGVPSWGPFDWIIFCIVGVATIGIGSVIMLFIWGTNYVEIRGAEVRFQRLKK